MPGWFALVLSVATYVGGVLSKPLQTVIEDWRARRKLRACLYADLGHNLDLAAIRMRLLLRIPIVKEMDSFASSKFARDSFEYALNNLPLFHQLRESKRVRLFYELLDSLQRDESQPFNHDELVGAAGLLIRNASDGLKAGDYSRKMLYKHISASTAEIVERREAQ